MVGVTDDRAGNEPATRFTRLTPTGDTMIRLAYAQRSLVEVFLPDGEKLWDPVLRRIDEVLEDDALLDVMREALARRHPLSQRRGRPGTPVAVALRMLVLKHLFDWSFDECEREVRANLVYRAFCRIEGERVPDAKTLIRLTHVLDGPTLKQLLERLVTLAGARRVVRGRRLRVDTTVVETNIHYPTDSTLLADGVRVLTRTLKRLRTAATDGEVLLRERTRSVGRRVFAIAQLSRRQAGQARVTARMQRLYRQLMSHSRAVVHQAETAVRQVARGTVRGFGRAQGTVEGLAQQLRETGGLVRRVLAQTRARILTGDTHYPDKLLSLFEPHTEAIRKGKAVKPTEFGKLVKIQEAEAQFITDYEVCARRGPDQALWSRRWSGTKSSSGEPRGWRSRTRALPPGRTSGLRTRAACDTWSCRGSAGRAARAAFERRSNGGPAAKGVSAP
jgi:transposase, IS5 family